MCQREQLGECFSSFNYHLVMVSAVLYRPVTLVAPELMC